MLATRPCGSLHHVRVGIGQRRYEINGGVCRGDLCGSAADPNVMVDRAR